MAAEDDLPSLQSRQSDRNESTSIPDLILRETQYLYSFTLLLAFISCVAWYSVYNAKKQENVVQSHVKGPGGKPLPVTKKATKDNGERKLGPHFGRAAKNIFRYLSAIIFISYVATGASMFDHAFYHDNPYKWSKEGLPWAGEWTVVHILGSIFFYLYIVFSLFDWRKGPNVVHLLIWILGLAGEIVLFSATFTAAAKCHFVKPQFQAVGRSCIDRWTKIDLVMYFVRILHLIALIGVFCIAWIGKIRSKSQNVEDGLEHEQTPLLNGHHRSYETQNGNTNGTQPNGNHTNGTQTNGRDSYSRRSRGRTMSNATKSSASATRKDDNAAFYRPQKLPHKTWWEYIRGYSLFFPYLWPKDSVRLQLQVLICFILVIIQRIVNIIVPSQIGEVVKQLNYAIKEVNNGQPLTMDLFPLRASLMLGLLWILQGMLGPLRSLLWIPVSQYSYRGLTTAAFNHVHSLSLDFHLSKRTGEVLSALNKGSSINSFLEQVTFQVIPMLFDLILSITVFYFKFGPLYAQINLIDTCWYLYMTIKMASTRADQRREMTNADREEEAVKNDSISSYETVKYFNAEEYESKRYRDKVGAYQHAEAKVQMGMVLMNICQTIVFNLGRILAALICGWQVAIGMRQSEDWFVVISYLTQLQGPLNFFGTFYRTVQQSMISGERLLELFKIQPTVVDTPHAKPLQEFTGHIRWNNVSFSYDRRRPALRNISFECLPGTTTAFVGESGGGKSTLFRHMFRYYDCDEGSIELDGKNVRDLTISSVRRHIGVVPQDTTLFNESLMYNLKYANPNATKEEVYAACKAASIHDRILSFPDQYETQVGERGLRLSGGEKQRVAIARTILKDPRIIMLDEATSALDSHTEQEIQDNVWSIGQGRTLLIIAHRLSTITHADQIIVLNAGTIVEKGTHDELLAAGGRYASMWEKQIRAERAVDAAKEATLRAARALRRANMNQKKGTETPLDGYNSLGSSASLSGNNASRASKNSKSEDTTEDTTTSGSSSSDEESGHTGDRSRERNASY